MTGLEKKSIPILIPLVCPGISLDGKFHVPTSHGRCFVLLLFFPILQKASAVIGVHLQ